MYILYAHMYILYANVYMFDRFLNTHPTLPHLHKFGALS